ncbi:MAG: thioesterase II family protein [Pirellulales bacterium]
MITRGSRLAVASEAASLDEAVEIYVPRPDARLRLVCLPYAGGSAAAFRGWPAELPSHVELWGVQLPGRASRRDEPPLTRMESLVEVLAAELVAAHSAALGSKPFALCGHSMGALVAFELARRLRDRYELPVAGLLVAGRGAPHVPDPGPALACGSEPALVAELRRLGGAPAAVLDDPQRRARLLRLIRADFAVCETYAFAPAAALDCPIGVFGGVEDHDWPLPTLEAWQQHTSGECRVHVLPGGHFFIDTARADFLNQLADELADMTVG